MSGPRWQFNGRPYSTILGLGRALMRDCGASSHGPVNLGRMRCYTARDTIAGEYSISAPELGKMMNVARSVRS